MNAADISILEELRKQIETNTWLPDRSDAINNYRNYIDAVSDRDALGSKVDVIGSSDLVPLKQFLRSMVDMYERTRGLRHTSAAILGAKETGAIIIAADQVSAKNIAEKEPTVKTVSMQNREDVATIQGPVIIDNMAVLCILKLSLDAINRLDKK